MIYWDFQGATLVLLLSKNKGISSYKSSYLLNLLTPEIIPEIPESVIPVTYIKLLILIVPIPYQVP